MTTQTGVRCPSCGEDIYSNSRHDLVYCTCEDVYVDGGFDYLRVGFTDVSPEEITREVNRATLPHYFSEESK